MRPASQPALIAVILILSLLTACANGAGYALGASGSCDNELFPVKQGAVWTYTSTGGPGGTFTYTDTLTAAHADGFTLTSRLGDTFHVQEWRCLTDGLQALQLGGGSAAGISTHDIIAEFATSAVTGISLPRAITPGMRWEYRLQMQGTMATPSEADSPSRGTYSVSMQAMGRETVTTAAGVFEAVRFQAMSTMDVLTDFQGFQIPVTYNAVTLIWYAPGIGFIKSVENGDFSGTAFSVTTELQSYSLP